MRCLLRTSLIFLSVILSEIVPRFDLIMGLVGGSMMGPLMFILPPLFYARLRAMEPQTDLEQILPQTTDDIITLALGTSSPNYKTIKKYYGIKNKNNKKIKQKADNKKYCKYSYDRLPTDEIDDDIGQTESIRPSFIYKFVRRIKNNFVKLFDLDDYPKIGPMVVWEKMKMATIVCAGFMATFLSTFYSLREAINYARFTPPCILNVTAATIAID